MRTLALLTFYACLFGGVLWAATRWATNTVRRHVDDGLHPSRYADLEFYAPSVVAEAERITREAAK